MVVRCHHSIGASQLPVISLVCPIDNKILKRHLLDNKANYNKCLTECELCTISNRLQHLECRLLTPHSNRLQINHGSPRSHIHSLNKSILCYQVSVQRIVHLSPPPTVQVPRIFVTLRDKPCLSFIGAHADLLSRGKRPISGANVCL